MKNLKPFTRIVLDEMTQDPDPIKPGEQASVVGYDDAGDLMVSWDCGRGLKLIPGVDKYHVVESDEELDRSFSWLYKLQGELPDGESSKCPRCAKPFDAHRGAVSRRKHVMICDLCGQQEAIEDFLKATKGNEPKQLDDWYIVQVWQGKFPDNGDG